MTHLAMAFTIAHPGVTSALIGVRTMGHFDGLLAGLDVTLTDDVLDCIDEIVPPGTDVGTLDQAYQPPALANPGLRRRPLNRAHQTRTPHAHGASMRPGPFLPNTFSFPDVITGGADYER
jgi:hypothetical protein